MSPRADCAKRKPLPVWSPTSFPLHRLLQELASSHSTSLSPVTEPEWHFWNPPSHQNCESPEAHIYTVLPNLHYFAIAMQTLTYSLNAS